MIGVGLVASLLSGCSGASGGSSTASTTSPAPTASTTSHSITASPDTSVGTSDPWILSGWRAANPANKVLQLVRPDGTGLHPIVDAQPDIVSVQHADWSPDGQRMVFEGTAPDASISLWTADADGANPTKIAECAVAACKQYAYPAWSHDGTTIAFIRFDVLPSGDWGANAVETLDLATRRVFVVQQLPDGATAFAEAPRWSPDDRRLVVGVETYDGPAENTVTSERLVVLAVTGKPNQKLDFITAPELWASTPDWHPAQDLIAFNTRNLDVFGDDPVAMNIWTIKSDGTGLRQLTREAADGVVKIADPTWTPDGTQLLVVVSRDTKKIAFLPASGGTPRELAIEGAHARLRPTSL